MEPVRQLVHVRIPGQPALVSRLVAVDGDELTIRAPVGEAGIVLPELGAPLDVGVVDRSGVSWFRAVATSLRPGRHADVCLRMLGRSVKRERRAFPRAPRTLAVVLERSGHDDPVSGSLADVSEGGLRVVTDAPLEPGETVRVRLDAGDREPFVATARVVHRSPGGSSGFSFELGPAEARKRLARDAFRRLGEPGERR